MDPSFRIKVFPAKHALAKAAAVHAAEILCRVVHARGRARIIAATGTSQFEFLDVLTGLPDIDWPNVEMFHLDEYIGLSIAHPASFRKILLERLIRRAGITNYHLLDCETDPSTTITRIGNALLSAPIDIAFVGIGENGHLAFNDPPADFKTESPYLIVELDEACRMQQIGEGWFKDLSEVPRRAVSMSVRQILKAGEIIAVVPESRKAKAVQACVEHEINPMFPASILRTHHNTTLYLDNDSAALLKQSPLVFKEESN